MAFRRYRQMAIITTVGVCLLTIAGAGVRLTGSGLGCDDWPRCNTERFIDVSTGHAAIEQLNRLLSGLIAVPTLLLVVLAFRSAPRGSGLRWPALGVLASILANGVVGGLAVLGDLHPTLVQSHFLLAMISIAFGLVAVYNGSGRRAPWGRFSPRDPVHQLVVAVVVFTGLALVTGTVVTGAGPHAGDETARRYGFDIGSTARLHSASVILAVGCAAVLAWLAMNRAAALRPAMSTWLFVAIVQGAIGYAQYFSGVPELLVWLHVCGATILWVFTVRLALASLVAAPSAVASMPHARDAPAFLDSPTRNV